MASGDLQASFGVDTEISNSGTNQLDLSESLVNVNASGITGFSIMPSGNLMVTTQIDARIGSTRTMGSGNTRGALFKVDVATKTATLIQTIPDTPPVELDNFTYGNEKFISDEMRRIWDYPTSARLNMGPPGYYVYRTWNLGVNDMDGSAEDFAGIVLHKDVVKRKDDADQFALNVSGAGYDVSTTTSGTEEGIQPVQIGPLAASIGTTFTVSESITSSTDLRDYEPQLQCVAGNGITVRTSAVSVSATQASATVTIPGTGGFSSKVFCTFVNDPAPSRGAIHVLKRDASDTNTVLAGATFRLYRDTNGNGVYDGTDTEVDDSERTTDSAGTAVWENLDYDTYFLREDGFPQGYASEETVVREVVLDQERVDVDIDNERIPGTVSWQKVDDTTEVQLLGGSQWTLTDSSGVQHLITDCTSPSACDTTDGSSEIRDTDPEEGKFSIEHLDWGSYTLVETKAPAGYVLGAQSSQSFTIDATRQVIDLGPIANAKAIPPTLPRAGGWGSDWFLYSGFAVLAAAAVVVVGYMRRKTTRC
ncbi:MSCRAMM family protein [Alloscardovia criceti]|uniref:MSCRAMM family protein n=1 Tax=Alloscardovia criceti TaxID=356828 RepID=UPI00036CBE1F|nr:SpaA isopeptide-forming pilin-related protein [Alloscardovia criceti]